MASNNKASAVQGNSTTGSAGVPPPISEAISPEGLSRFRIDNTNFVENTQEVLTTALIVPPAKEEFIRTHPDPGMKLVTYTIRSKREHYLIEPAAFSEIQALVPDFKRHSSAVTLRPYITRDGQINLWPLKMESPYSVGGNGWNVSAFNIARMAQDTWLRVTVNNARSQYVGFKPESAFPDPVWPPVTIDELVDMASRTSLIDSIDHAFVRELRGLPVA